MTRPKHDDQHNHAQPPVQTRPQRPVQPTAQRPLQPMAQRPLQPAAPPHFHPSGIRPVHPTFHWKNQQEHLQNHADISTGIPVNNQGQNLWSSDIFGFMNDTDNAVTTFFAPCVTFGQIAEIVDEGRTTCASSALLYGGLLLVGMPCMYSYMYRAKIRQRYGLLEYPASDLMTHIFCEPCALAQEYRELKHHGFNPNIGWIGNVEAKQQKMMSPPMGQRMMG